MSEVKNDYDSEFGTMSGSENESIENVINSMVQRIDARIGSEMGPIQALQKQGVDRRRDKMFALSELELHVIRFGLVQAERLLRL